MEVPFCSDCMPGYVNQDGLKQRDCYDLAPLISLMASLSICLQQASVSKSLNADMCLYMFRDRGLEIFESWLPLD